MKPMKRPSTTAARVSAILLSAATATRQRHQRPHQQPKRSLHVPATQQAAEKRGLNAKSRMAPHRYQIQPRWKGPVFAITVAGGCYATDMLGIYSDGSSGGATRRRTGRRSTAVRPWK